MLYFAASLYPTGIYSIQGAVSSYQTCGVAATLQIAWQGHRGVGRESR